MIDIVNSKMAEHALRVKLKSYFKVPKDELNSVPAFLMTDAEQACPVLRYPILELNQIYYPVMASKLTLYELIDWTKFAASGVYESFLHGEGFVPKNELWTYNMSIYMPRVSMVWIMTRQINNAYYGKGGVFVRNNTGEAFSFEPIKGYLETISPLG